MRGDVRLNSCRPIYGKDRDIFGMQGTVRERASARYHDQPPCMEGAQAPARAPTAGVQVELAVRFLGRVPYEEALCLQEKLVDHKLHAGGADSLLVLEHEPVFTLGRGAREADLRGADRRLGIPVFRVGRGGGVTYHGPGQLVAYPIVRLPVPDVRAYVQFLLRVVSEVCATYRIEARVDEEKVGVWAKGGKVASLGIGLRRWVAFHGLALNVKRQCVHPFQAIVPCRTPGLAFTSLEDASGETLGLEEVAVRFCDCFVRGWSEFRGWRDRGGSQTAASSVA
ncbi:MAG: lipoyl(octanoyl) transferase LipB [Candidatus Binatia bacterium]|nr:lipoyl(octanoyl) transferase LipB [Candidatus Binatia bacterium]